MLRVSYITSSRLARGHFKPSLVTPLSNALQNAGNKEYSAGPPRPQSFIGKIVENFREEKERNKKLKESIKDFRKDMEAIEQSETLEKYKQKFKFVIDETADGSEKAKLRIDALKKKMQSAELLQKASKVTEDASKQAMKIGQTISQKGDEISNTQAYKSIKSTANLVIDEIDQSTFGRGTRVYKPPKILKMRIERDLDAEAKIIEANTVDSGMVLHKDSKLAQSWENFKNNNPYVNKAMEWRTKLDESDNPLIRASMLVKDKASELFGNVFQRSEISKSLTEICKMDPNFDKERFLLECEYFIFPNILEAAMRPDLRILKDWCSEAVFSQLSLEAKEAAKLGWKIESKILDLDQLDLLVGGVTENSPFLAVSFQVQQMICFRDSKNEVMRGDPSQVMRIQYVFVMGRDPTELNSHTAWKLVEMSMFSAQQLV